MSQTTCNRTSGGFTIVELMIATAVFSVVLLVITAGVLSVTNGYFRAQTVSQVQVVARQAMNQMSQDAQFGSGFNGDIGDGDLNCFQIGNNLYSYRLGAEISTNEDPSNHLYNHGFVVASAGTGGSCAVDGTPVQNGAVVPPIDPDKLASQAGARELLGPNMRLTALNITQNGKTYSIHIKVVAGDDDLLTPTINADNDPVGDKWISEICAGGTGEQYCGVSELTTTVVQRL